MTIYFHIQKVQMQLRLNNEHDAYLNSKHVCCLVFSDFAPTDSGKLCYSKREAYEPSMLFKMHRHACP